MYLLLSGEGLSDIGACNPSSDSCDRDTFQEGPMAIVVDQLVALFQGYDMSHLETMRVSYVSEGYLAKNKPKPGPKSIALRGKKRPIETTYFYRNARALAIAAKAKKSDVNDDVIAILFRDSDGTASAERGLWESKRNSVIEGFKAEDFDHGVAMIPKPKSEAWILCATKSNKYQHCSNLELESGNDKSPNSLKSQLSDSLRGNTSVDDINHLLNSREIDIEQIDMPSFNAFKQDLEDVVRLAVGGAP